MQQAINRAFDILELISANPETPTSFNEIAQTAGLNTGTCANIIKAMVQRGYLEKLDDKKGYLLGKKLYGLTSFDGYKKDIIQVAKPVLERLTKKVSENTLLAVLKESSRIVLLHTQSEQIVQATSPSDKPAYDSSTGRLLIAMMTDEEVNKFVTRYGLPTAAQWKEAATSKKLLQQLRIIREEGYAFQEFKGSIIGLAAPVKQNELTIASICVFMPSFRFRESDKAELVEELKKAAEAISNTLTG